MKVGDTAYLTKYALSGGIVKTHINSISEFDSRMARLEGNDYTGRKIGVDFFLTLDEAIADCEERRIKKLKQLDKQAKKIAAINFENIKE